MTPNILLVVGARPNFPKVAPIYNAIVARGRMGATIVHTGQHYDDRMSDIFFRQLGMPKPDVYFGIGGGTQAEQMAGVMIAFEKCLAERSPDLVLVVGDVNSTVACALVATRAGIPVAHVEAGLRSWDRRMPEEINRLVTDKISDLLFTSEPSGELNLLAEGVNPDRIFFVGNVMIDSLIYFREKASQSTVLVDLGVAAKEYVLVTMHRPSNVDNELAVSEIASMLTQLSEKRTVVFPVHPRTWSRLEEFGVLEGLQACENLRLLEPQGYLEFLHLMENAAVVVTDSGGIQEETTYLQVPCLTLRENTERPVTVERGTNELMELDAALVSQRVEEIFQGERKQGHIPTLWDGHAAERIVEVLERLLIEEEKSIAATF